LHTTNARTRSPHSRSSAPTTATSATSGLASIACGGEIVVAPRISGSTRGPRRDRTSDCGSLRGRNRATGASRDLGRPGATASRRRPRAGSRRPFHDGTACGDAMRFSATTPQQPRTRSRTLHHTAHSRAARHRARPPAGKDDVLEDLPQSALGRHRRRRFLQRGGAHARGPRATWSCSSSTSRPDAFTSPASPAGRTASGWRRSLATLTDAVAGPLNLIVDRDPLYTAHFRSILQGAGERGRASTTPARVQPELECLRRVCWLHKARMLAAHHPPQRAPSAERPTPVCGALPRREQPSGPGHVIAFLSRNSDSPVGPICRRERLGGLLPFYERNAARTCLDREPGHYEGSSPSSTPSW
jgi:hypothetical protein